MKKVSDIPSDTNIQTGSLNQTPKEESPWGRLSGEAHVQFLRGDLDGRALREVCFRIALHVVDEFWPKIAMAEGTTTREDTAQSLVNLALMRMRRWGVPPERFAPCFRKFVERAALQSLKWFNHDMGHLRAVPLDNCTQHTEMETPDLEADAIRRMLDKLSAADRIILVLCYVEGYSYEELAEALGVSVGTVKSRLFNARMRFRKLYAMDGIYPWQRR